MTTGLLELLSCDCVNYLAVSVQSSSQIITTNKPRTFSIFTGQMPFLSPNQQCQSTEGKVNVSDCVNFFYYTLQFLFKIVHQNLENHCYHWLSSIYIMDQIRFQTPVKELTILPRPLSHLWMGIPPPHIFHPSLCLQRLILGTFGAYWEANPIYQNLWSCDIVTFLMHVTIVSGSLYLRLTVNVVSAINKMSN